MPMSSLRTHMFRDASGAIADEIRQILALVEGLIPANPGSPENEKLEKQTAGLIAAYFKQLEQAFPFEQLAGFYNQYTAVKEAGPVAGANDIMEPILRMFRAKFLADLIAQHVRAYLTGSTEMVAWGALKGGKVIAYEGPPLKQAIDYAQNHCAQLVTRMDEESKNLIAQTVSDAIQNKRGVDGLARDIRKQFEDMTRERSRVIARTETADALEQAFVDRADDMGVTGKEWVATDPCPICEQNEKEGVVPIDHVFSGGVTRPPQHPSCRCCLAPVMLPTD